MNTHGARNTVEGEAKKKEKKKKKTKSKVLSIQRSCVTQASAKKKSTNTLKRGSQTKAREGERGVTRKSHDQGNAFLVRIQRRICQMIGKSGDYAR